MSADLVIVFALYPELTQLDFTAPLEVLWRLPGAHCVLASAAGGNLSLSGNLQLSGLARLSAVARCDVLFVPGGYGTVQALGDAPFLAELQRLGTTARYVSAVCTGSLLLAAAGLLHNKRAASHWAWRAFLSEFGVLPDPARVVRDGNVFTGGGVTAGLDLALSMAEQLAGRAFAEGIALSLEYAPAPPFESGRPELARPEVLAAVQQRLDATHAQRHAAVVLAAQRLATQR